MNSPFKKTLIYHNLMLIKWNRCKCGSDHKWGPCNYCLKEWDYIVQNKKDYYFTRKFKNNDASIKMLQKIKEKIVLYL